MSLLSHIEKNNLHHAYLIEGEKKEILPEIFALMDELGVATTSNPDFCELSFDSFKIDDARALKSFGTESLIISGGKRFFVISANNFLVEAQNTLLKIFEEPAEGTHFFIILPDANVLLPTLLSRLYLIKTKNKLAEEIEMARHFLLLSKRERIDYLKKMFSEESDEEKEENSNRSKAIKFLNALEEVLHKKYFMEDEIKTNPYFFEQILNVRGYLRQPGSSVKNLMESVALVIPG